MKLLLSSNHRKTRWGLLITLIVSLMMGSLGASRAAAAPILVWKPFLQQLTHTGVIILWTTQTGTNPVVRYSTDTSYSLSTSGTSRTLTTLATQMHRVALSGLQPDTTYNYKVYTDNTDLVPGETLSFRTAPSPGSTTPFKFLAFGDEGFNWTQKLNLRDRMLTDTFSFVVTTGDNAYPSGAYGDFDSTFFQPYSNVFDQVPVFPAFGDHEYATSSGAPYLDLFDLPTNAWRANDKERYYSFDYGNAHFIVLDSNAPLDVNDSLATDDMFDWLRNDLSQTTQAWKIVSVHAPPYSIGTIHGPDNRVRTKLVPIFEQYGVDLVLNGNEHIYQRSKPLLGGQVTTVAAGGIVYVISGAGSAATYPCGSTQDWVAFAHCNHEYAIYARVSVNVNGLTVEAVGEDGAILDTYILADQYTLTITSAHGTVTKNPNKATYTSGEVVQLTATPAAGWSFASWSGDASGASNPVSVTMNGNKAVTANYTQNQYTLTITSAHGTVAKSPNKATYTYGEMVLLTATPAAGWSFANWSGDASGATNPTSILINGNKSVTANYVPIAGGPDTTGVFRPSNGVIFLKLANTSGFADIALNYGLGGDYPVTGDWDGNGTNTIGVYRNGQFLLRNSNTIGFADMVFAFGQPGDQPVAGDWNGDGIDTIGVFRNGLFLLRNSNSAGAADANFVLGNPGDVGITGDWDGNGSVTTGVFRPSNGVIFLKNTNTTGFADIALNYGIGGDQPVTGDWDDNGTDTIGVYRNGQFLLRNSNTIGFADLVFALGNPGDMPIAGNWDGIP